MKLGLDDEGRIRDDDNPDFDYAACWSKDYDRACLDGTFTLEQLRAIIALLESKRPA